MQLPFPHPERPELASPDPLPLWVALLIFGSCMLFFSVLIFRTKRRHPMTAGSWAFYIFLMVSFALFVPDVTVKDFEPRAFHLLTRTIGLHWTQVLVALFVVTVGYGAHWFKQANKLWYGYSEMLFGVLSAVLVVSRINFAAVEFSNLTLAQYGTLVGAAYVVARGLNNVSEARRETKPGDSKAPSANLSPTPYQSNPQQSPASL